MALQRWCLLLGAIALLGTQMETAVAQEYRRPYPNTRTTPVGQWEFNGREWVYQNGGQSYSGSSPVQNGNPITPQYNQTPNQGVPGQTQQQPQPNTQYPQQPNYQAPQQPGYQQTPKYVFPPASPNYGAAPLTQHGHWIVLYRPCEHEPWRRYNCYGNECAAYDAAIYLSRSGYYAAIAVD